MDVIKGLFKGIVKGLIIACALFVLAYLIEILNCLTCGMLTCGNQVGLCTGAEGGGPNSVSWSWCFEECNDFAVFPIWNLKYFIITCAFCGIAGSIIGSVYEISMLIEDARTEAARRQREEEERIQREREAEKAADLSQRQENAAVFQRRLDDVIRQCNNHVIGAQNAELHPPSDAQSLQTDLWNAINGISTPLQELRNVVDELESREGASEK